MLYSFDNSVKRADFNLRAEYPEIETIIYKINDIEFCIYCKNIDEQFDEISKIFDYRIRMMSVPVKLIKEEPKSYVKVLESIQDNEIVFNYKGIPFRTIDKLNLLASKFPTISFLNVIGNEGDYKIKIHISGTLRKEQKIELNNFLESISDGFPFCVIENSKSEKSNKHENPFQFIYATSLDERSTQFERRDESIWYDNIEDFYNLTYQKENLYFIEKDKSTCFVDYSISNTANIRVHILLYDLVYLALPIQTNMNEFFKKQDIKDFEFIELIKNGRLKILLLHPAYSYDVGFLEEIYKFAPNSIISRRGINSAILLDIISLNQNFFLNDLKLTHELYELTKIFSSISNIDGSLLYKQLTWPIRAYRKSFSYFDNGSPKKIGGFGVNSVVSELLSKRYGLNRELEFMFASESVHIASAINGAYFPTGEGSLFNDRHYTTSLSQMLSFYKNSTVKHFLEYHEYIQSDFKEQNMITPINLFQINEYIPLKDFNQFCLQSSSSTNAIGLLTKLNKLSATDKNVEIRKYNERVNEILEKRGNVNSMLDVSYNSSLDLIGLLSGVPFLGTGANMIEKVSKKLGIKGNIRSKIITSFEKLNSTDNEIDFLTKINPAARLKEL